MFAIEISYLLASNLQLDVLKRRNILPRTVNRMPLGSVPRDVAPKMAYNAAHVAAELNPASMDIHFQFWHADLTAADRSLKFPALWKPRKDLFRICVYIPGLQGWIVVSVVIWLPLVHKPAQNAL
jgi:hypothetical protein